MPDGTPGKDGDVIHVYAYGRQRTRALRQGDPGPAAVRRADPQSFPPTNTTKIAWPDRLAISPDGRPCSCR